MIWVVQQIIGRNERIRDGVESKAMKVVKDLMRI
jgi:tetrahydromethanopterin S-methyltransferase subunit F